MTTTASQLIETMKASSRKLGPYVLLELLLPGGTLFALALLQSGLARLELVTRREYDDQVEVLRRTRDKVERHEARVAELEAHIGATNHSG